MAISILLADDHNVVRHALRMFLALDPDFEVVAEATNGAEAVQMAQEYQPDVVLMDLLMPVMDGITATSMIRRKTPHTEVLALTSVLEDVLVLGAVRAGAIGYLLKDTQAEELRTAIKGAASGQVQFSPQALARLMRELRGVEKLATQAPPAPVVTQLVRQQEAEARERERREQEMRVARLIQQTLLPKELPSLPGWQLAAHYQPAREIGGDFYDVLALPDGHLGLVIGDVAGKGVPAALIMATTRTVLRAAAQRLDAPGEVLARVNDLLYPDLPPSMFITCFYAILDPASGELRYANAGQDLPYLQAAGTVSELYARGMPLGLMPGMGYEERRAQLAPGAQVLLYSDGLVEAHDRRHEMFGFPRLHALLGAETTAEGGAALIARLLAGLEAFTGAGWEQEDDITLLSLQRCLPGATEEGAGSVPVPVPMAHPTVPPTPTEQALDAGGNADADTWRLLGCWRLPSVPGAERQAMEQVAAALPVQALSPSRLDDLKTAVAEATANAVEHGNQNRAEQPVTVALRASTAAVSVRISDQGSGAPIPAPGVPDLPAKLAGAQAARGWGLFLIQQLVDELRIENSATAHTVELILYRDQHGPPRKHHERNDREGGAHGHEPV